MKEIVKLVTNEKIVDVEVFVKIQAVPITQYRIDYDTSLKVKIKYKNSTGIQKNINLEFKECKAQFKARLMGNALDTLYHEDAFIKERQKVEKAYDILLKKGRFLDKKEFFEIDEIRVENLMSNNTFIVFYSKQKEICCMHSFCTIDEYLEIIKKIEQLENNE